MKAVKTLYYTGLGLSLLVGIWHFFVPYMFQWYSYIPEQYENLTVGIDWVNFFFSLLLTGLSAILILMGKKMFAKNHETMVFYGFSVFVWLARVVVALVHPWPVEPNAWASYGQLIASIVIFVIQLIPLLVLTLRERTQTQTR